MSHTRLLAALATLIALAPAALAEEQPPIDAIVASHLQPGEPQNAWNLTADELARRFPAVARAVAQPDFVTPVDDAEEASTHAFFAAMSDGGYTALRVGDGLYSVGITLAQGIPPNLPPETAGSSQQAPAAGIALAGALLGAAAVARRQSRA